MRLGPKSRGEPPVDVAAVRAPDLEAPLQPSLPHLDLPNPALDHLSFTVGPPKKARVNDRIRFRQAEIALHESWKSTPLESCFTGSKLDLNLVTASQLASLTPSQLKTLLILLERSQVISEVHNADGTPMSQAEMRLRKLFHRPQRISGAAALVIKALVSGDTQVLVRAMAAAPAAALAVVRGSQRAHELVTGDNLVRILQEMQHSGFGEEPREINPDELDALGSLVSLHLDSARDRKDVDLASAVREVFHELHDADVALRPEVVGILVGAMVSGLAKCDQRTLEHAKHATRVTNHVWAASWLAGPWAGIASTMIVGLGDAYTAFRERSTDLLELARYRRNRLEAHWLQHPPPLWSVQDRETAMAWVDLTIRSNRVPL
jgi:hypothetical protein